MTTDPTPVNEAYSTARELLVQAEADAVRIRAEADRYKRQREQEAELLVAKARRLLTMAEERAASIRRGLVDLDAPASVATADPKAPAAREEPERVAPRREESPVAQSALDSILANAVSNAVHRALPAED